MGKLSGLLSTAIFVGLVVILFYFCCRVKRKPGTVVQRSALDFNPSPIQPITPTPMVGGVGFQGYPSGGYAPHQPQMHQVYAPTTSETSGQQSNGMTNPNFYPYNTGYPSSGGAPCYPHSNNLPYPQGSAGNMPLPTSSGPNSNNTLRNEHFQQASAPSCPYPSAPAPMEDLPPPYEAVVHQFK